LIESLKSLFASVYEYCLRLIETRTSSKSKSKSKSKSNSNYETKSKWNCLGLRLSLCDSKSVLELVLLYRW